MPRSDGLDALLARDAIGQVILRLARATDRRDEAAIRACYHPDGSDDHGAFQGSAADFAAWVPRILAPFAATMHFTGPPRIELEDDVAQCETCCVAHHVFGPDDPGGERDGVMALRYQDRFERRGGGPWLIARRRCIYDFTYVVPVGERWPLDPPFVRGRPGPDDPAYEPL